ncbi:hypothetical protein LA6_005306 (plasmid) [Paracoccaceae bacterium]|nr:hypothetical protein LA6_005306 [Paracoccaceae bacterium]
MANTSFTLHVREDGSARLSQSFSPDGRRGLSRLSCGISAPDLVRLVLFCEAVDLRATLGAPGAAEIELDGLWLSVRANLRDVDIVRIQGLTRQDATADWPEVRAEIAGALDICQARAEDSRHGAVLKDMIWDCPVPDVLSDRLPGDLSEVVFHRLREMALLLLADEAAAKGSVLGRKLRGKKTREAAERDVRALLDGLVAEFVLTGEGAPDDDAHHDAHHDARHDSGHDADSGPTGTATG